MTVFRRLRTEESGVSLTELLVTLFLLAVVSVIFTQTLGSTLFATRNLEGATRSNDNVRLVLQQIDREVRAAQDICEPRPGQASDRLHFISRSASSPTGTLEIVYLLDDPDADGIATMMRSTDGGLTFQPVADSVVNGFVATESGVAQPMYESQGRDEVNDLGVLEASPSFGKVLAIRVWVDTNPTDDISPRLETTEIAGRNIWTPNASSC